MKAGRALIVFFQKMRIKNLRGASEVRFKKTRLIHLETWKTILFAIFCATGV